jgi:hypothetical protein
VAFIARDADTGLVLAKGTCTTSTGEAAGSGVIAQIVSNCFVALTGSGLDAMTLFIERADW